MTYRWANGYHPGLDDVNIVKKAIDELIVDDSPLTPECVVEAARAETSPLHGGFEWDDTIAGHQYRLEQARRILRCVAKVEKAPDGTETQVRQYHVVQKLQPTGERVQGYIPFEQVMKSQTYRDQVLERAYAELQSFLRKYATLEELLPLREVAEQLLQARVSK